MRHVDSPDAAATLAAEILAPRTKPLVVISTDADGLFQFPPEQVERELGAEADVVTIQHGAITYALSDGLPEKCGVFEGAARSYPVDFGEVPHWSRSLLRFPSRHTVDELIEDALSQVVHLPVPVAPGVRREWVHGVVERVSGATGNVAKLPNGDLVMVVADNLPASVSLADALHVGDPVEGWLLDRALAPEAADVDLSRFTDGGTTLARVVKVTDARATLRLHPTDAAGIILRRRDVVPSADEAISAGLTVADLVHVGQTVRVRVTRTANVLGLSLIGVDPDDALIEPLPLLRGGSPWLHEGSDAAPAGTPSTTHGEDPLEEQSPARRPDPAGPAAPEPAHSPMVSEQALAEIRDEITALRGAFGRLATEVRAGTDLGTLDQLRDEAAGLAAELQRERGHRRERDATIGGLRLELREARAQRVTEETSQRTQISSWPTAEDWLRYEVLATWATRTLATDKTDYPLKEYTVLESFIPTLTALDDNQLEKALRAVVDVVTGRAVQLPARQVHRLRSGEGGGDPFRTRADGAACMRVSVEVNTPSARRLHYWQRPGGIVELSRVVLHDDFEP